MRAEGVCEHFKDDEKSKRVFNWDANPISVKVIIDQPIRIKNNRENNCANNVKQHVTEEDREALIDSAFQNYVNKYDFERETAEPGNEVIKMHGLPTTIP